MGKRKVPGPKSKEQIDKEVKSLGQDPAAAEGQAASGGEAAEAAKAGGEGEGEETLNGEGAGNGAATEGEETKGAEDTGAKKSSWKSKIKVGHTSSLCVLDLRLTLMFDAETVLPGRISSPISPRRTVSALNAHILDGPNLRMVASVAAV